MGFLSAVPIVQGLGNKESLMYLLWFYMNKSEFLEALVCNIHELNVQGWVLRASRNSQVYQRVRRQLLQQAPEATSKANPSSRGEAKQGMRGVRRRKKLF